MLKKVQKLRKKGCVPIAPSNAAAVNELTAKVTKILGEAEENNKLRSQVDDLRIHVVENKARTEIRRNIQEEIAAIKDIVAD